MALRAEEDESVEMVPLASAAVTTVEAQNLTMTENCHPDLTMPENRHPGTQIRHFSNVLFVAGLNLSTAIVPCQRQSPDLVGSEVGSGI